MNDYPVITCLAQVFYHNIIINNKTGPRFIGIGELDKGNELRGLKTKGSWLNQMPLVKIISHKL